MNKILHPLTLIAIAGTTLSFSLYAADICNNGFCVDGEGNSSLQSPLYQQLVSETIGTGSITNSGQQSTGGATSGTSNNKDDELFFFESSKTSDYTGGSELENAIKRGYAHGLTKYTKLEDFNAENALLREDASKIFYQAARTLGYAGTGFTKCAFADTGDVAVDLQKNILSICQAGGLMKGDAGNFFPFRRLNNAEALTIIARISGIKDTTSTSARRTPYLEYVKKLPILDSTDINESTMENVISRGQIIILLYKLGKVYDKYYGDFSLAINDPAHLPTGDSDSNVSVGAGIVDTPKFTNALLWMYANKMTKYWKASDYNPYEIITKEQAAKVLSIYHTKFLTSNQSSVICRYSDIDNSDLRSYIEDVCRNGIFENGTRFSPKNVMTKEEFIKALLVMQGQISLDANTQTIIEKALSNDIIRASDLSTFNKPITRYEVAIILHTLYLKQEFINNLNSGGSVYYVIAASDKALSGSTPTTEQSTNEQQSLIDITTIDSKDFNNGYISLFGNVYKINKKEITNYFPTSYSWYGTINDINTDRLLGSINLAIGQKGGIKVVIEGYIVFNDSGEIYTVFPSDTLPYYTIKKVE